MYTLIPILKPKLLLFFYRHIFSIILFSFLYYIAYYYLETESPYHTKYEKKYNYFDFLFFSISTQSTIGYGDVSPTHNITKFLTSLQLLSVAVIIIDAVI